MRGSRSARSIDAARLHPPHQQQAIHASATVVGIPLEPQERVLVAKMRVSYWMNLAFLALGSVGALGFGLSLVPDLLRRSSGDKLTVLCLSILGSIAFVALGFYARSRADLWDIVTDRRFIVREGGGRLVEIRFDEISRVTQHLRNGSLQRTSLASRTGKYVDVDSGARPGGQVVADFLDFVRTRPGYLASIPTCRHKP